MQPASRVVSLLLCLGLLALATRAADTGPGARRAAGQPLPVVPPVAFVQPAAGAALELGPEQVPEPVCDRTKVAALLRALSEPASAESPSVEIDCSLTLPEDLRITKRLVFKGAKASGVTVTGTGKGPLIDSGRGSFHHRAFATKMVQIVSDNCRTLPNGEPQCSRPMGITLRNLRIRGSVAISADPDFVPPDNGYARLFRLNAPANIVFDRVTITGQGLPCDPATSSADCNLLYLFAGVSHFRMVDSQINGSVGKQAVALYLDDLAFRNTFRKNVFSAETDSREMIAIDSASENLFVNNHIHVSRVGGIFLYRNCGEGGTARRGTPSHNMLINNVFTMDFGKVLPAIKVGARNYHDTPQNDCPPNAVDPNPFYDLARFNAVIQNQVKFATALPRQGPLLPDLRSTVISVGHPEVNTPNFIKENDMVEQAVSRRAGCFVPNGYPDFLRDGQFVNVFHKGGGEAFCTGFRYTCRDGDLARSADASCKASQIVSQRAQCQASASDKGCRTTVAAPRGKRLIGFKAACNLEFGQVSLTDVDQVSANMVKVLRSSDRTSDGLCVFGDTALPTGEASVGGILGQDSVFLACREVDANGGDCQIKARLFFH